MDLYLDDLDFDSDKVKDFLKHKLEEIQANNAKLERTIAERKHHLHSISNKEDDMDEFSTPISLTWTRMFNGKYVFGFTIKNDSNKILENPRIILIWTSHKPLHYEFSIFDVKGKESNEDIYECKEKNCKLTKNMLKSRIIHQIAYLIIVFDIPNFTDNLQTVINGIFVCDQDGQEKKIAIPEVSISPADAMNRELYDWSLTNGSTENLLAALCSTTNIDLLLAFPEHWSRSMDCTFEIHCSLRKIELINSCKNYYVAHGLSQMFYGSIVEIHVPSEHTRIHHMKIYYRDEGSLLSLLHHFHQTITGVTILPLELYESYLLQNSSLPPASDVLEEFEVSVKQEIKTVEKFLKSFQKNEQSRAADVKSFNKNLTNLESQTDLIYLKICYLNEL